MQISSYELQQRALTYNYRKEEETLTLRLPVQTPKTPPPAKSENAEPHDPFEGIDPKYRLMARLLEALTGQKITYAAFKADPVSPLPQTAQQNPSSSPIFEYRYHMEEHSALSVGMQGTVTLSDGTERTFSLSIQWEQHFAESFRMRIQDGTIMSDPLIISLEGAQPLSSNAFAFNLSGKGDESIPYLVGRAGYLSRDLDGSGQIENGNELFGPASGKGFMELSRLDDDRNGWIDGNDAAFKQLKLWMVSEQNDTLLSLQEAGIGAISLQTTELGFTLKSDADSPVANFKHGSIALGETEGVFGVFEIDVAV